MAEIQDGGGKRGRSRNVELNLVPFIDLMSVLITFLLISAVWTQVSMIKLGASFVSQKNPDEQEPPKPNPLEDLVLRLDVKENGYTLLVGKDRSEFPLLSDGSYDSVGLLAQLQKVKQLYPDKVDCKMAVSDSIVYEKMIIAMDVALKAGFEPGLLTGGPQ